MGIQAFRIENQGRGLQQPPSEDGVTRNTSGGRGSTGVDWSTAYSYFPLF